MEITDSEKAKKEKELERERDPLHIAELGLDTAILSR